MSKPLTAQHSEWLSLVEISGPFLTLPVLKRALPMGLDPTPLPLVDDLRVAWKEVGDDDSLTPRWIRWVLSELLGLPDEVLKEGTAIGPGFTYTVPEHSVRLRPDFVIVDPDAGDDTAPARLLVSVLPAGTELDERLAASKWFADAVDRMAELCRGTRVRMGLVTNGDQWAVVDAPVSGPTGVATWDANLWLEERITLDAFTTLLGVRRFFSVVPEDTLEAMLAESANAEAEVTDQLGKQVRQAVELLVDAMSRANRDRGGHLFDDLSSAEVYEAAVTVMMRLVFLLSAEERGLFLLGDETYDSTYAVSTLRGQLEEEANTYGEEVIARRTDAWHRLLATFRMVYGGAQHENLRLPAYGGSLFDPDRFPILEGRKAGEPWRSSPSNPLPIDNRTVLHILGALQVLTFKDRRGAKEARRLSFRALDVEQIGHVYEGLLDHSAVRVDEVAVGLGGRKDPEIALALIEAEAEQGRGNLVEHLADLTGLSGNAVQKALDADPDPLGLERLTSACDNDHDLADRIAPYLGLLRLDLAELPMVYLPDSMYVTQSSDRRSSGTYYTPKTLAEQLVLHTLEPLVYSPGPAEGVAAAQANLKSSAQILSLKVCDMAMGSGAFLVAACRYLSARLLEAWEAGGLGSGDSIALASGGTAVMPIEDSDRETLAHRLIADACLYGVDRNPMAVEMAKLSMWLVTLARDRPFTFVDHALRCGDSLLGITDRRQLDSFHLDPLTGRKLHGGSLFDPATQIEPVLLSAMEKRRELESFPVVSIQDSETKRRLLDESIALIDEFKVIGDVIVGAALSTASQPRDAFGTRLLSVAHEVGEAIGPGRRESDREDRFTDLRFKAEYWLDEGRPPLAGERRCLHWPLEFPEVFSSPQSGGFDAIVGNPPFLGNKYWKDTLGVSFQGMARHLLGGTPGKVDLAVLFHRRAYSLLREGGFFGLLGSTQSAEGQAIEVGLGAILATGTIMRAVRGLQWPGDAKVRVNLIWVRRGEFEGTAVLNGVNVSGISAALAEGGQRGEPERIKSPDLWAFEGVHNGKGACFILTDADEWYERLSAEASPLLRPYVSGEDLGARPLTINKRWVVDCGDLDLGEIESQYPVVYSFLMEVARPARTAEVLKPYKGLHERWWQFWNTRSELYRRLRTRPSCIVLPKVAMYILPTRAPSAWCFTNQVIVVEESRPDCFGVLRSSLFGEWMTEYCTSFGAGGGIRPSVSKGVNTFVMPEYNEYTEHLAGEWEALAMEWCSQSGIGLTALQNAIHDGRADGEQFRALQAELDAAVLASYGWNDLDLELDFRETRLGQRFALEPRVRSKVLDRLMDLNSDRHEVELAGGGLAVGSRAASKRSTASATNQLALDDGK